MPIRATTTYLNAPPRTLQEARRDKIRREITIMTDEQMTAYVKGAVQEAYEKALVCADFVFAAATRDGDLDDRRPVYQGFEEACHFLDEAEQALKEKSDGTS